MRLPVRRIRCVKSLSQLTFSVRLMLAVSASVVPLGAQEHPHEPLAFKPITHQPFDVDLDGGWERRRGDRFSLVLDAQAPCSPPGVGRVSFSRGFPGGSGPANLYYDIPPGYRKLYVSFCVRLSPNWVGHRSGVNKILHFWIADRNRAIISATGSGSGRLTPQFRLQALADAKSARNLGIRSGRSIERGRWQRVELIIASNTPGIPNGRVQWWVDGQLAGDFSQLPFVGPGEDADWRRVSWNPTWGGTGGAILAEQFMDIDDLYISGGV